MRHSENEAEQRNTQRLRSAKREGRVNTVFVIAVERNGTGRYEFRRAVDAEVL